MHEAIVLAGGLGTRLRTAVSDVPKPMAPIAGRPFLEFLLDYWISQGIRRFMLSVGYRHEAITAHFGSTYRGAALCYSIEDAPLGTGGGLLQTINAFDVSAPVLLLNGDTFFAVELRRFEQFARKHDADVALALFETNDRNRFMAVDVDVDGRVRSLAATPERSQCLVNGGVYWLKARVFREQAARHERSAGSLESDIFPSMLIEGRRFFGAPSTGTFIDIGLPDDFRRAQDLLPSVGGLGGALR